MTAGAALKLPSVPETDGGFRIWYAGKLASGAPPLWRPGGRFREVDGTVNSSMHVLPTS